RRGPDADHESVDRERLPEAELPAGLETDVDRPSAGRRRAGGSWGTNLKVPPDLLSFCDLLLPELHANRHSAGDPATLRLVVRVRDRGRQSRLDGVRRDAERPPTADHQPPRDLVMHAAKEDAAKERLRLVQFGTGRVVDPVGLDERAAADVRRQLRVL